MAKKTHIEWTEMTWNPVTGCDKVSPGCKNCYAERMAHRLKLMGSDRYRNGFEVTLQSDVVELPKSWKMSKVVFVNSMSDLFHQEVPDAFILKVFQVMNECPQHQFQVLTKRPERLTKLASKIKWTENIWMGVSVESQLFVTRAKLLSTVPAKIKFLSIEPLLGEINDLFLKNIHWVIVGGESGPGARLVKREWVESIYEQCKKNKVPFFFKQWGGIQKHRTGRELFGRTFDEMPAHYTAAESASLRLVGS
jgi:protein gp37